MKFLNNARDIIKFSTVLITLIFVSPLILIYFDGLNKTATWCWIWLACWFIFFRVTKRNFDKGLWLIASSSLVASYGKYWLLSNGYETEAVIEPLSQMMLLIGGGVGGNFMATDLLSKK